MSEVVEISGLTAGGMLREARLASGMHIAALAVALKVPVSKLEALEADNFTVLPDTVFVRALASSVCRTLKVDPAPILSLLPQSPSPRLSADSAGINAPVKGSVAKSAVSSSSFSGGGATSRSVGFVVLALLVGALALYFFPRHEAEGTVSSSGSAPTAAPDAVPAGAAEVPTATVAPALAAVAAPAAPTATPAPVPAVAVASAAAPAVVASAASAADAATGTLVLRARSASWVQVKDATGALALQRNLAAGESVAVSAPPPLAVVVGRADATEVIVRGKPFDLAAVSRENVARFEVK